ncbi:hypothetical protein Q5O89_22350 [Peribacillus frigoritolerans]|nr:hypothetical protein [Peribacillus frigoritolerans]
MAWETPQARAEEAPGPLAESECLEWKSKAELLTLKKTFELISEIRSLSADCLPSLLDVNVSGVSASPLFGRSVANFFHPLRSTGKNMKDKLVLNMVRDETGLQFFLLKNVQLIGTEGTRPLREKRGMGDPAGARREAPARPRKASAWSGNQRSHITNPQKNVGKQILFSL